MEVIPSVFIIAYRNLERVGVLDEVAQFENGAYAGNITAGAIRWHDRVAVADLVSDIECSLRGFDNRVSIGRSELDLMNAKARTALFRKAKAMGLYPYETTYRVDPCDFRPLSRRNTAHVLIKRPLVGENLMAALERLVTEDS